MSRSLCSYFGQLALAVVLVTTFAAGAAAAPGNHPLQAPSLRDTQIPATGTRNEKIGPADSTEPVRKGADQRGLHKRKTAHAPHPDDCCHETGECSQRKKLVR